MIQIRSKKELVCDAKKGSKATIVVTAGGYSYDEAMKVFRINYTERFEQTATPLSAGEINATPPMPISNQIYGSKEVPASDYDAKYTELSAAKTFPSLANGSENVIFVLMNLVLEEFVANKYYGSLASDWTL